MASSPQSFHPILSRLKLRHLRVLHAIEEHASSASVALAMHVSPAAISKTLSEVESVLGAPVFERGPNGMQPTHFGSVVLASAKLVLGQAQRMAELVEATRTGHMGKVSIAFRANSVHGLVADAMHALRRQRPQLEFSIVEGGLDTLVEQLVVGELDLLFSYDDVRLRRADLSQERITPSQPIAIVASQAHPLFNAKRITKREIAAQDWCIPAPGTRMEHHLIAAFRAAHIPAPTRFVRVSDVGMTTALLRSSNMLAVLPLQLAQRLEADRLLRVLDFQLPAAIDPLVVVWNSALAPKQACVDFRDLLQRC
ncbi:MAG: LysR family transcriptional regulator [Acidovorax sp.]|jgi:DNA-binding transcriptional LysR family regulator|nr:LysR family transcriptional regulator [Acidovorax sp.]